MSENKISATTKRFKKLIEDSFPDKPETKPKPAEQPDGEVKDIVGGTGPCDRPVLTGTAVETETSIRDELEQLRVSLSSIGKDMERYATSKEQFKTYSEMMDRRDSELANRKFIGMLEQLSAMREDFFKLCKGMDEKLDRLSAKDVLNSFEAYGVDMENILTDCGVVVGPTKYEKLNTVHQRIVDVIPTDDESRSGMIESRISDGYEYNGRALFKERVNIYKFSENGKKSEGDE